ncbi:hypothetical protein [Nocardioides pacificus]
MNSLWSTSLSSGNISAHGIGGAKDLPISPELAIVGAVAALVVSFTVLAVAWRTPRYTGESGGRPAPAWLEDLVASRWFAAALQVFGLAFFLYAATAAIFGQDLATNPFLGIFYVFVWVGLVPLSLLFGPFWKAISPVRTINALIARVSGSDPDRGIFTYPERLGYWPAAFGLFAFVWLELVYPYSAEVGPTRLWCALYVAVMLIGGSLFGNRFYESADPFEVYSTLVGKLSVFGWRPVGEDRELVLRSPLANLDTVEVRPGLVAVVGVLFGSTAYDSFSESPRWVSYTQGTDASTELLNNLALIGFCVGVSLILVIASMATGVGPDVRRGALPDLLAHAIVPIIVGYIIAHYLSMLVGYGQQTLIQMSDPFSNGSNLLGTADLTPNTWLTYHPTFLANTKVVAIVIGHVLGVIASHDRAVKLLPKQHQLIGQLPMLVAMVGFTAGGLYLLFAA